MPEPRLVPPRYRLKLNRLDFISAVDQPAQETAKVLLIKRRDVKGFARVAKVDEELGLVFCWAFTSTKADGSDYFDLQGDAIDQDFVKACADFMDGARAVDTMHDGKQSGRVVFAMPMTPEVASAFGVVTKQTGLMVALRPSAEDLAKFKSGEFTGVSIAGLGEREQVGKNAQPSQDDVYVPGDMGAKPKRKKRKAKKQAVLTSEEDGHAHTLDLDDPIDGWSDQLQTSYQTAEGADTGHSHAWVFDEVTGVIGIAADSGHSHTVDAVVPADVLAAYAALDAAEDVRNAEIAAAPIAVTDDPSDGVPAPIPVEESSGKTINVVIAARAPRSKSTPSPAVPTVKSQPRTTMPTEQDAKIADLEKRNAKLEQLASLSDAQRAHFGKLSGKDADAFLAKSFSERDIVLGEIEKSNEVIYTSEVDGSVYRKSDDPRLIKMAKAADLQNKALAKSQAEAKAATLAKRASEEIAHLPGELVTKAAVLEAIDGIADEKTRKAAHELLKAGDNAIAGGFAAHGVNVHSEDPSGTDAVLKVAVTKYQADHKLPSYEAALVAATAPGGDDGIRKLYDATQSEQSE